MFRSIRDWIGPRNSWLVIFYLYLGFLNYKPETSNIPPSTRPVSSGSLFASPSSFDWRTRGVVTPVKDQGYCGSCWAFGATGQYESMLAIATRGTLYDLAEQYGLECDT